MTEIASLKKQRATNKGRLTNIINFVRNADDDTSVENFKTRLARVEQLMLEFTAIENKIFALDPNEESDVVYEENYYTAVTGLNTWIRSKSIAAGNRSPDISLNVTNSGSHHEIKLPKINIPPFSGDYTEWQSFFDLFCSTIHDSTSLSPVQKFQYLKGCLRGEASVLLRHISITECNYIGALNKLKDRYDRKRHIINAFLRTFIEQPSITIATTDSVKGLMDTSDEVIRGLKALGESAETRDHWLIFLLVQKLDEKSKVLWAQHVADLENPQFHNFMDFLSRRMDTLESANLSIQKPSGKLRIKSHITTDRSFNCTLCNEGNHSLFDCKQLNQMDIIQRKNWAKTSNRCFNCLSQRHLIDKCLSRRRCQHCHKKHHTLLHINDNLESKVNCNPSSVIIESTASHCSQSNASQTILPTALVNILDSSGRTSPCRALLDSGSQASFISERCMQRLGLKRSNAKLFVSGLGSSNAGYVRGKTTFIIRTSSRQELAMEALILPKITSNLPHQSIEGIEVNISSKLQLADPYFQKSDRIDILIGADYFFCLLEPEQVRLEDKGIILQKTIFGWVVSGKVQNNGENNLVSMVGTHDDVDIDRSLRKFWELESIPNFESIMSPEELYCERHFNANVKVGDDGRFTVNLPFKNQTNALGKSIHTAIQRLRAMERRFTREPEFYALYHQFMEEYQVLNHMEEIPPTEIDDNGYYLPHHGVVKQTSDTTKLRVVFDGSARTTSGLSINDCLAVGPTVQSTLYSIILRFREHKFVMTADVEKMYRQVRIADEDTRFQKILWRNHSSEKIRHYRLNTVTYGLASSSFLATRVLQKIADDNKHSASRAANAIQNDIYVDDLMTGASNEFEAMQLKEEINGLLSSHGFNLRKWRSNSVLISGNKSNDSSYLTKPISESQPDDPQSYKVLGIHWTPAADRFNFSSILEHSTSFTKRSVVSEASRLFDPLGWLAPVIVGIKIFVQKLWAINLKWDDPLPNDASQKWHEIRDQLKSVNLISMPRFTQATANDIIELHGFSDASQSAYGAVVYQKVTRTDGKVHIHLITAKTKVAPIKQVSLPRLELCAAVMLSNLLKLVQKETTLNIKRVYAWTDSRIVLDWLSSHPKRWTTFVANRTSEILSTLTRNHWNHVPSVDNPADCASRGLLPQELVEYRMWWHGPVWLHQTVDHWPSQQTNYGSKEEENTKAFTFTSTMKTGNQWYDQLITKYSSITKLKRVLAYVFRYITMLREKKPRSGCLRREELFDALFHVRKYEQSRFYVDEMNCLRSGNEIHKSSNIKQMNPFIDKFGLLRVGGRLENADISYSSKHPIILHPKSRLSILIIQTTHIEHKHAGASLSLAIARQDYWIPGCRSLVRRIINQCVTCAKHKAQLKTQLMGNLPSCRVDLVRPFLKVGIDYAGPLLIRMRKGRGQKDFKSYICLFICLSTKAIHMELVGDLTSEAFLAALKRFVSRRGVCQELFSDNGSNFVGAERKLREEFSKLIKNSKFISDYLSRNFISWHFIPPAAPHFGGVWEAGVKAAKYHLRRVVGRTVLTYEGMVTLLTEIEAILNSRPLCAINSTDIDALTPSHFLIGHSATRIPEVDITHLKPGYLTRWQMIQQMAQHFWRRWVVEYLQTLQPRPKWREKQAPVKIGDIVVLKENAPVNHWPLAKIIKLHPGSDGFIRVVTLKTQSGELMRPITRLCVLPISDENGESSESESSGQNTHSKLTIIEPGGSRAAVCSSH